MRTLSTVAVAVCASVLWADNYPRRHGIDIQHYVFRVQLGDAGDEIAGETTLAIRFTESGITAFDLDLAPAMSVEGVVSEGSAVPFVHEADRLRLAIAPPKPGTTREFTVVYKGVPAGGLKFLKNRYGERCIFSANWPDQAHQWLPTVDHPYDKATGEFVVTAPAKYQVVANGLLTEEVDLGGGRRETHWRQSVPIATWLYNIGIAQFASRTFGRAAGVPLQTWVFPQDRDTGIGTFEIPTRQAIEFYADHIGPYPYEKLAAVESAGNGGGMEHATAIFYGQKVVTGRPASNLVAHETAHQWFGDSVTESDWDDVWLSEGFATYFAALAAEHYEGRDAFVEIMKRSRAEVLKTEKRMPGVAVVQQKPWKGIPNPIVYQKGGWALHLLRGQIGNGSFWAGIREYYRRYRDGNASTADFRRVMEEVSGQDLEWFFTQWLYRAGSPSIEGAWKYDSGRRRVEIELTQTQPGAPFRLPLEIAVNGKVTRFEMTAGRQSFEIPSETPPASVELDPNTWALMDARVVQR